MQWPIPNRDRSSERLNHCSKLYHQTPQRPGNPEEEKRSTNNESFPLQFYREESENALHFAPGAQLQPYIGTVAYLSEGYFSDMMLLMLFKNEYLLFL